MSWIDPRTHREERRGRGHGRRPKECARQTLCLVPAAVVAYSGDCAPVRLAARALGATDAA
ncbi:hypothetical protein Pcatena_04290 [Parolsenella catena]|uniref:Uncharacterized protein n=1 Tax=Parolsenella catena TaxID=2003188 RepID=A0A3G9K572_9ACTN|nr:hypothetical protein Pcatena_04290 [Parolsenella catena]